MPNATIRADGGAMPADRRTILRSIVAVGAIGAAPIAAKAALAAAEPASGPAGLDAALFALIDDAREAETRRKAAGEAVEEAIGRLEPTPPPHALLATAGDVQYYRIKIGDAFHKDGIDALKRRRALARSIEALGPNNPLGSDDFVSSTIPLYRDDLDARIVELDAAHAQWRAEVDAATVRSGVNEAEDRYEKAWNEKCDLLDRIARTPSQTMAGMLGKLALVAPECEIGTGLDDVADASIAVLVSVAVDFKTMDQRGSREAAS